MQLNLSQHMKMSQQMKLAPRMIQSMEILQLPVMALNDRIEEELQENVVLEKGVEEDSDSETATAVEEPPVAEKAVEERELVVDSDHNNEADFERLLEMSADWPEDNLAAGSRPSSNRIEEEGERKLDAMSNMEARPPVAARQPGRAISFFRDATAGPRVRRIPDPEPRQQRAAAKLASRDRAGLQRAVGQQDDHARRRSTASR